MDGEAFDASLLVSRAERSGVPSLEARRDEVVVTEASR